MWCKTCSLRDVCKYRKSCEELLERNSNPYYVVNDAGEETPIWQCFICDSFVHDNSI